MPDILIVDDDRAARVALRTRLEHCGYETLVASCGQMALDQFLAHRPPLILLDAAMPDMSGFEVCRQVRAADPRRHTKVLFLSGASTPSAAYVGRCVDAVDADGYLRKPYDLDELMALVHATLTPGAERVAQR